MRKVEKYLKDVYKGPNKDGNGLKDCLGVKCKFGKHAIEFKDLGTPGKGGY